jgi:aryl-alcohol dehydrogenase-like predicted oxidoreductase
MICTMGRPCLPIVSSFPSPRLLTASAPPTSTVHQRRSWGYPDAAEEMRRVLRRSVEPEVNYLDTAAYYGPLVSDHLIVEALYPYPEGLIIGTKSDHCLVDEFSTVFGVKTQDRKWKERARWRATNTVS